MEPLGIHHVSVNVREVARSLAFYTRVLGGTERTDRPDFDFGGAWIDFGGQQLHLIEAPVPADHGQHLAVQVADLTAMRARIAEIDESLDIARDWADQLRAERDHLVSQSGPLRRGLIAGVD